MKPKFYGEALTPDEFYEKVIEEQQKKELGQQKKQEAQNEKYYK